MTSENLSNLLLHYGRKTSDIEFHGYIANTEYHTRIRTFVYNGKHFYHLMCNGELVEVFELK